MFYVFVELAARPAVRAVGQGEGATAAVPPPFLLASCGESFDGWRANDDMLGRTGIVNRWKLTIGPLTV